MVKTRRQTSPAWRATFALLVLLFGAFAPAVKLVLPAPITCGMACCEASGVCYCQTHSSENSVLDSAVARADKLESVSLSPACPARCAQLPASLQKHASANAPLPRHMFVVVSTRELAAHTPSCFRDLTVAAAHAPRAPPTHTLA